MVAFYFAFKNLNTCKPYIGPLHWTVYRVPGFLFKIFSADKMHTYPAPLIIYCLKRYKYALNSSTSIFWRKKINFFTNLHCIPSNHNSPISSQCCWYNGVTSHWPELPRWWLLANIIRTAPSNRLLSLTSIAVDELDKFFKSVSPRTAMLKDRTKLSCCLAEIEGKYDMFY